MGTDGYEGWKGATERAVEAFVSVLLAGFRHKRSLRGKEQYQGMWPVLIIVANLVIFGMFLKTWLLEAGD